MAVGTNRYADYVDMQGVFPEITEYYASNPSAIGTTDARNDLIWATRLINQKLQGNPMIKTTPLATTSSGDYDEYIKLACCNYGIYRRIYGKLRSQFDTEPDWIKSFKDNADQIMNDISDGNIILEVVIGGAEKGISEPTKNGSNTGIALFYTSSDGYNGYFTGVDFRRTWKIQIDATTAGNGIGQATFKWSYDNGNTWEEETLDTGTTWEHLWWNTHVRWDFGTGTGNQLNLNDSWTFETVPIRLRQQANTRFVQSYEFDRG